MENSFWWLADKDTAHEQVFGLIRYLDTHQTYRTLENLRHMKLYGNLDIMGLAPGMYTRTSGNVGLTNRLTYNIIQSMVDTVTSKIAKNRPRATFLTDGGNWKLKRKAKLLDQFVGGQFYALELYRLAPRIFLDGSVFGTGFIKFFPENGKLCAERVFPDEIMVDDAEAIYGKPRQMHQRKLINRDVLKSMYPKFKEKIDKAKEENLGQTRYKHLSEMVLVAESWHLPSGPDAGDGRHTITIETATLIDEAYEKNYFPFAMFRWSERLLGFFGQGLAEQLTGIQVELNKLLRTAQVSFHLATPAMLIDNSSKIVTAHLNNEVGRIIKHSGLKPEWWAPNAVSPALMEHIERLFNKAYEIAGVSQLSAQSKKPIGLDSGKALRDFNDIESERFMIVGQAYENFFMDCAKIIVDMSRDLFKENKNYSVTVKGKEFIKSIKWSEVDLEEDQYLMQVYPTSALAKDPSGRLQDVQDLMQAGIIDPDEGADLLDFPDLKSKMRRKNAAKEDIERTLDLMIYEGEYNPPEPFQNLELGVQMGQEVYLDARNTGVPEERLELVRRWIEQATTMLNPPSAQQAAPPPMMGPPTPASTPQAVPTAPPVSPLLPNVPKAQ